MRLNHVFVVAREGQDGGMPVVVVVVVGEGGGGGGGQCLLWCSQVAHSYVPLTAFSII